MKVLVTGGSGFIGSNIVKLLLDNNYKITVLDDLSSGYQVNIQPFIDSKSVEFIQTV